MGRTLGGAWARVGHEVRFGSRTPGDADVPGPADLPEAVARWAEVVVLTVPGVAARDVVAGLGGALDGRIVIDATNRSGPDGASALSAISAAAPGAVPVRAFSTVGWEVMAEPRFHGIQAGLFYCSSEEARGQVDSLVADVGFRPVWVGDLAQVELIESLTRLWGTLALRRGLGRHLALALLTD